MGVYLNSKNPFGLFQYEAAAAYFIDKSGLLEELIPLVDGGRWNEITGEKSNKYICITRPRRFGKTLAASMIASFFSAMVVYGFLNYEDGNVSIPNKELMDRFSDMLQKESSLGYVHCLARESDRMLQATKAGDTDTMSGILEYAHDMESPLLYYNNEAELTMIVNMVYLSARDQYRIEREDKAGIGYVDFIFYPIKKGDDCLILELKVDHTPEEAIQQIKDRRYALKFSKKPGGSTEYTGRILAVGISYGKADKKHKCKVEVLRE